MNDYDVIVIGTRVAGAPVAALLARQGYRVLAVDRATFPSDTLSTHIIHPRGMAALRRWGLLERLLATGCPPIETYSFDFGPITISGRPRQVDDVHAAYAPRRTVLDLLLVQAAREAGVEVRERFEVDEVLVGLDGEVQGIRHGSEIDTARLVIGADGRNSKVARTVRAGEYHTKPRLQHACYTYFSGLPTDGLENFIRPDRGFACAPTHDGLTMVVMGWPQAEARAFVSDLPGNFRATLQLVPEFADRVAQAEQREPFHNGAVAGWLRQPYGPGWALVGDAGYNKDPITAQGITDAFLDAERCAEAVDKWLGNGAPYDQTMGEWHQQRDAHALPLYELTSQFATLEPPPPDLQALLGAVHGNPDAMEAFVSVIAGSVPVDEFFSEENVGRIFAAAGARGAA